MLKVAFQGERGAYSEAAAMVFFKNSIETMPFPTFHEVLESTEVGKTDYAVLPVENSLEGSVGESYDLLLNTKLHATGEIYHRIRHCLIGFDGLEKIDTVYSHPQALGQCRKFIEDHHFKAIPTYDTAGSVKILLELKKDNISCIASRRAAEIYNVPIIKEGIEDNFNNYTRFLVLSNQKQDGTAKDKTSIIFSIKHTPGALYSVIEKFHANRINLTKIESRPTKTTPWEYNFYVDFEGNQNDRNVQDALEKIKPNTIFLKILGSYPRAEIG
ncbi:MAG TPA: prephenate dehydratase [Candidatus Nitrosotalea sp.]|nr:prephenate dehydratase [Nitrososphaerota archaeon]HKU32844.1 prephenate dehydratase [Candidatus Nitrosotalea sp.]